MTVVRPSVSSMVYSLVVNGSVQQTKAQSHVYFPKERKKKAEKMSAKIGVNGINNCGNSLFQKTDTDKHTKKAQINNKT